MGKGSRSFQGSSFNSRRNLQLPQAAQRVAPPPAETPNHALSVSQSTVQQQGKVQEQTTWQQGLLQQLGSVQQDEAVPLVLSTRVERFLLVGLVPVVSICLVLHCSKQSVLHALLRSCRVNYMPSKVTDSQASHT